ncbi:hypothetical protein HHK36_016050 [Tetracentron sinense]|uniref:Aspartate aminotransferase n=1 Tax=Tetracentron sinense TaxID=13715 RepID=A0A835DAN3_TETSI|nr:hypothetical protein HHK36_016050 [Tetracentron sinense]
MQMRIMWRRCLSTSAVGLWDNVGLAPKDPILSITEAFLADSNPNKINLGVGAYRDDEGKPVVLQCVREADAKIAGSEFLESISRQGSLTLIEESVKLAYGETANVIKEGRFAGVQALSGTGACRLFAEFQRRFQPESRIYLPVPTWSKYSLLCTFSVPFRAYESQCFVSSVKYFLLNIRVPLSTVEICSSALRSHHNIWRDAQVPQRIFHYYHPESKGLHFSALMDDVKVKNHFPFFDMAYQGFASGDLDRDARAIRIFLEDGHLIGCAQSFAKIMGLYGQRVGCLSVLCLDAKQAIAVKSQLQQIARAMYSNPPVRGALLVSTILSDPDLKELWVKEVKVMANRVIRMRATLRENLEKLGSPLNWEHITNQIGMFCYSGLTPEQVDQLMKDFHIYMTCDGRISMAGITTGNVDYLANAMHEVTKSGQEA